MRVPSPSPLSLWPFIAPLLLSAAACSGSVSNADAGATSAGGDAGASGLGGPGWIRAFAPLNVGALASDAEGNVIVGGAFAYQDLDLGLGPLHPSPVGAADAVVAELSPSGEPLWNVAFQSPADGLASAVAADAHGNVFAARTVKPTDLGDNPIPPATPQMFLHKLDHGGHPLWTRAFPTSSGASVRALALAVEPGGDVLLAGDVIGTVDLGGGPVGDPEVATFVARFAGAGGSTRWVVLLPGATSAGLSLGAPGEVIVAWSSGAQLTLGGFSFTSDEVGVAPYFLAALDLDGQPKWVQHHAADSPSSEMSVAAAPDGSIATAGLCAAAGGIVSGTGMNEWCMTSFDAAGTPRWATMVGQHVITQDGARIAVGKNGDVVLASEGFDFSDTQKPYGQHLYVTRANAAGATLFSKDWRSEALISPGGVAVDPAGSILVGGFFDAILSGSGVDLGNGQIWGSTGFVIKLAP